MTEMIVTRINRYHFDTRKKEDRHEYNSLKKKLKKMGLRCFETWGAGPTHREIGAALEKRRGGKVYLKTSQLFRNQWNEEGGMRAHDWAQDARFEGERHLKTGYWLEPTHEMKAIRESVLQCGYCGRQEKVEDADELCTKCIGSEYLRPDSFHLLRMVPVSKSHEKRPPLPEEEWKELLKKWTKAQIHASAGVDYMHIESDLREAKKALDVATLKWEAYNWLAKNGLRVENLFYNSQEGMFVFGAFRAIDPLLVDELVAALKGFEWPYRIEVDKKGKGKAEE